MKVAKVMFSHVLGGGVSVQEGVSVRETPYTLTCGRYSSYWNAFLFYLSWFLNGFYSEVMSLIFSTTEWLM